MTPTQQLLVRWRALPHAPICNLRADRAPRLGSYSFPLCWRCTAIFVGMLVTPGSVLVDHLGTAGGVLSAGLLALPCTFDAVRQYYFGRESTNARRILTGLSLGIALGVLAPLVRLLAR